ncbi:MAG: hypothetical protein AAGF78_06145 [Pseudomonadota bacterium]
MTKRHPDRVMSLAHLGAAQPTRLSFLRRLMDDLARLEAKVSRPTWDIDADGHGHAVYTVTLPHRQLSLIAFANELDDDARSDRVIATAWDAAFVLFDGVPETADIKRLRANVPLQEAGRYSPRELTLSRANKSMRLFTHVVEALRSGQQPDRAMVAECGYLMRTTAVYGNGKFGLSDRTRYAADDILRRPFTAEMLTVWLIRGFTHDLAEHLGAGKIDRDIKRFLGIGNATGLGMAPFLVTHPQLLHAWTDARETVLAAALGDIVDARRAARLLALAGEATRYLASWRVPDTGAMADIEALRADWAGFVQPLTPEELMAAGALADAMARAAARSPALEELVVAWIIEAPERTLDPATEGEATQLDLVLAGAMTCRALRALIADECAWALAPDFAHAGETRQFWYVSEEKLEPRLGARHEEGGADRESPLDTARQIAALYQSLPETTDPCFAFLAKHPEHRAAARRVQFVASHPYAEIRANLIGEDAAPIHLLRCKLAHFGATRFDPKSRLWTRVTLAQGLPLSDEIGARVPWLPSL